MTFFSVVRLACAFTAGAALASSAAAQSARELLDRAAASVAETDTLIAQGWFRGVGAGANMKVQVEARMAMERLDGDDPMGFRLAVDATVAKPMFDDDVSLLRITYDGETFTQLNARTGEAAYSGPYNDAGRRYTGFTSVLWGRFHFDDPDAFRLKDGQRAEAADEATVAGIPCRVIEVWDADNQTPRPDRRLFIGAEDWFPRRVEILSEAGEAEGASVFEVSGVRRNVEVSPRLFEASPGGDAHAAKPEPQAGRAAAPAPRGAAKGLLAVGAEAPGWTLPSADGDARRLADYRGKVVVLDFWATWCAPCRLAMPALQELHEQWSDEGVVVLGVATDETGDPAAYMRKMDYDYPVLLEGERIKDAYRVQALPTLYVIGPDGTVLHAERGFHKGFERRLAAIFEGVEGGYD